MEITCRSECAGCAEQLMKSLQHVRKRIRTRHVRTSIAALHFESMSVNQGLAFCRHTYT